MTPEEMAEYAQAVQALGRTRGVHVTGPLYLQQIETTLTREVVQVKLELQRPANEHGMSEAAEMLRQLHGNYQVWLVIDRGDR